FFVSFLASFVLAIGCFGSSRVIAGMRAGVSSAARGESTLRCQRRRLFRSGSWNRSRRALPDLQREALRVAVELRRIHALDLRDAGLVRAAQLDACRVFEYIRPLRQVV